MNAETTVWRTLSDGTVRMDSVDRDKLASQMRVEKEFARLAGRRPGERVVFLNAEFDVSYDAHAVRLAVEATARSRANQ